MDGCNTVCGVSTNERERERGWTVLYCDDDGSYLYNRYNTCDIIYTHIIFIKNISSLCWMRNAAHVRIPEPSSI